MDVEVKEECDGCQAHISWVDLAYTCSYNCTWCPECADGFGHVCPNCSGELRRRARRTQALPK